MADPFIGEIRMFSGNFAPQGWAFCNGQLFPIAQNTALFSLLGTMYGGDGRTNFGLPNLQGRLPMHRGQAPGLSQRDMGEQLGTESVTLTAAEMPLHTHTQLASSQPASTAAGPGGVPATPSALALYGSAVGGTDMAPAAVGPAGGGQAHPNMAPYLTVSFIIALQGLFPPRN